MLYFSRIKVAAILFTTLVVCSFAVSNFVSDETIKSWPAWAQRRLVLGPDLQGGTSILLEVDQSEMRAQFLQSLRHEVHSTLHDAYINLASPPAVRSSGVEVRLREGDFQAGFTKLRELSQPLNGVRSLEVVDVGGGVIRITPEPAMTEREQQIIDQSIPVIEKRMLVKATAQREGAHRILLQVPGVGDPRRPWLTGGMMFE